MSPARILIADDEPRLLRIVAMYLEMEGYEVRCATDGEAALVLLATADFDLAILDVMMPGHDGIEVCQRLRSNPRTRTLPILMFTALSSDVEVERARQAGATHLITKPYNLPGLGSLVEQTLAQVPASIPLPT